MKPSEILFEFPVIIYSSRELERVQKAKEDYNIDEEIPYAKLLARIPIEEICGWEETFIRGVTIEDVIENGAQNTLILTKNLGPFVCSWKKKRFEEEYDKHFEKLEKYLEENKDKIALATKE